MNDKETVYRQDAIDVLNDGAELLRRVSDDTDIVGTERIKYRWGLELLESCISDMKELPSAQPEQHYCKECKWSRCHINVDKYGKSETYWHCLNWDGGTDEEGFCHEWERREDGRLNLERGCDN